MPQLLRRAFLLFLAFALTACTTFVTVSDTKTQSAAVSDAALKGLVPGNQLQVQLLSGEQIDLALTSVDGDTLVGTVGDKNTPTRIPLKQVQTIERKELDTVRTVVLVLLLAAGTLALIQGMARSTAHSIFNGAGKSQ